MQYIQLCLGSNILEQTLKPVLFLIPWRKNPRIIWEIAPSIEELVIKICESKTQESSEAEEDDHHHAFVPGYCSDPMLSAKPNRPAVSCTFIQGENI